MLPADSGYDAIDEEMFARNELAAIEGEVQPFPSHMLKVISIYVHDCECESVLVGPLSKVPYCMKCRKLAAKKEVSPDWFKQQQEHGDD